jgi:uncharacterized protein (DUF1684 family)
MRLHFTLALVVLALTGCARDSWPDPPAVEQAQYQKDYDAWREDQRASLQALAIVGIWPLKEGETPFGSDAALPIVLPAAHFPPRAGVVRRAGDVITIAPAPGAALRLDDATPLQKPAAVESFAGGPVHLLVTSAGDDRRWLMGTDESHPALKSPPAVEAFPLDARWRVTARFDAFDQPKTIRVPDVRGGEMEFMAVGQLVFRIGGEEMRLTAIGEPGSDTFFVMFKDPTNQTTTFRGYRILTPRVVKSGEFTVVDFNFASNPPCAYSRYTVCPLPPPENKLPVAIEAGLKRLPGAISYAE